MNDQSRPDLTIEHQVNVDLWKHDDNQRQKRNYTFLTWIKNRRTEVGGFYLEEMLSIGDCVMFSTCDSFGSTVFQPLLL